MMFNDRFTNDNKIHFIPSEWICTDLDTAQFCRKVNDTTFEYIQLKDLEKVKDSLCHGRQILSYLNDKTDILDWYQDEICIEDYDADELGEYVSPYGGDEFLEQSRGAERNQLMAECIFETDIVNSGHYD
jgi:hypothetical protein